MPFWNARWRLSDETVLKACVHHCTCTYTYTGTAGEVTWAQAQCHTHVFTCTGEVENHFAGVNAHSAYFCAINASRQGELDEGRVSVYEWRLRKMCLNGRLSLTLAILKPDLMARPTDAAVSACTRRIAAESGQAWLRLSILRTDREIIRPNR